MAKLLIPTFGYMVLTMVLGMAWNLFIFQDVYADMAKFAYRPEFIMPLGIAAMFAEGVALSALFKLFYNTNVHSLRHGILLGLLTGTLSMSYAALVVPAKFVIAPVWQYVSLELLFGVLHYGLAGLGFAVFFRYGNDQSQAIDSQL